MKQISLLLIILLLTALFTGCEDYSSASIPTGESSSTEATPTETTGSTGHVHSYLAQVFPATCTEDGYMVHTCDCGHSFVDSPVSAMGHTWDQWVTTDTPTETEEGLQVRTCQVCDAQDSQILEALGQSHSHSFIATVTEPTCTEGGYTVYCCVCGEAYSDDFTDPLGHSWSDWEYTDNGQIRTCSVCDATDLVASSHTHSYTEQIVAATCLEGGYKLYTCTCGESYQETVSDPLGHTWGQWNVTVEPTATTEGVKERECEACGEKETASVEALPVENGFVVVSYSETVGQNEKATVCIKGQAGVEYTITVYYKSGPATASGLEAKDADGEGYVTWIWKVGGRTTPGTYEIVISGGGVTQSIYFTIEDGE